MPTFKVDDCFAQHPKTIDVLIDDPLALALWVLAGSYCARYLTDGRITARQLEALWLDPNEVEGLAGVLVRAGFWDYEPTPPAYQFREWDHWQETRAEVEARREQNRSRQRRYRERNAASNALPSNEVSNALPPNDDQRVSNALQGETSKKGNDLVARNAVTNAVSNAIGSDRIGSVKLDQEGKEVTPLVTRDGPVTEGEFNGEYGKRYQAARGLAWYHGQHGQAVHDMVAQLNRQVGDPRELMHAALDRWFGDKWAAEHDYPPRALAKQLGRYMAPPAPGRDKTPDEVEIERKRAAQREHDRKLQARLDADRSKAVKPPPLDDLIGSIGNYPSRGEA